MVNTTYRNTLEWRLLLLDGHESHCNYPFLDFAWRHRILIFVLPAHSSHLTQPLDIGLFGPLQRHYGVLLAEWLRGGIQRFQEKISSRCFNKLESVHTLSRTSKELGQVLDWSHMIGGGSWVD